MKKLIFFLLFLAVSFSSIGQQSTTYTPEFKIDYLKKSKHQKTAAWILLGSGPVLIIAGVITASSAEFNLFGYTDTYAVYQSIGMASAGVLSMLGSIPLFNASSRNKRKGMSLSFKNETAPQIQKSSFVYKSVPSLTLKISL